MPSAVPAPAALHAMSVDVEDWCNTTLLQVSGRIVPPTQAVWRGCERLLEIFAAHEVRATWFFLGEVAAAWPGLVQKVCAAGHEPAVHGWHHQQLHRVGWRRYGMRLRQAKDAIEQAAGVKVVGHRAPDFALTRRTWPLLELLVQQGLLYDSSLFPMRTARYGVAGAERAPHRVRCSSSSILEIPVTVLSWGRWLFPAGGGGYLRHLPLSYTNWAWNKCSVQGQPIVCYLHPADVVGVWGPQEEAALHVSKAWRLFPIGVRCRFAWRAWLDQRNAHRMPERLHTLLSDHKFSTMAGLAARYGGKMHGPTVAELEPSCTA